MKKMTQVGTLGLALALTVPAMAFQGAQGKSNNGKANKGSTVRFQGPGPHAGDWLRRNMNTSPAQQKQELEKSDEFRKLSPDQQQQLLKRLNRFNSMTPDQKNRVLNHMEWLDHLPPEKKKEADALHQQFHNLSVDRRQAVRRVLFGMRDMSPDERQKNIESPEMKANFSENERQIIKGYTQLGFPDQHSDEDGGSPQEQM